MLDVATTDNVKSTTDAHRPKGFLDPTANLTLLGQYTAANFYLASDGFGGTVVTDPLVGSAGHAALFGVQT